MFKKTADLVEDGSPYTLRKIVWMTNFIWTSYRVTLLVKFGWTEQLKPGSRGFILVFEKVWQQVERKTTHY